MAGLTAAHCKCSFRPTYYAFLRSFVGPHHIKRYTISWQQNFEEKNFQEKRILPCCQSCILPFQSWYWFAIVLTSAVVATNRKKEADFRFVVNNVEVEGDGQKEETPDNKVEEDKKKGLDNTIKNLGFFRNLLPNLAEDTSQHQEVGSTSRGVPPLHHQQSLVFSCSCPIITESVAPLDDRWMSSYVINDDSLQEKCAAKTMAMASSIG